MKEKRAARQQKPGAENTKKTFRFVVTIILCRFEPRPSHKAVAIAAHTLHTDDRRGGSGFAGDAGGFAGDAGGFAGDAGGFAGDAGHCHVKPNK